MALYPQYVPDFRIEIGGDDVTGLLRSAVTTLTYTDGIEGADRVEMTLANDRLQWLDHPLLQVDQPFSLSLGYAPDPLEEVFVGEVTGVNVTFPNSGVPTITVVAHDFLQRLTTGTKDRAFMLNIPCIGQFPIPDPVVAALVSATDLLIPFIDPVGAALSFLTLLISYAIDPLEAKKAIRLQQGQSDFEFLTKISKENGWEMYIDHTQEPKGYVLRFSFLVQDYSPSIALQWGASLQSFTPKLSTVGQVAAVSTRIWIPSIKLELVIVLGWDYDRSTFDLMVYPGFGSLQELLSPGKAQSVLKVDAIGPAAAPRALLSELLPRLNNRLTGSGAAVGDLRIKAGKVIQLDGLGEQFSGLYRITSATHSIGSGGMTTNFEARKEIWFGPFPVPKGVRLQGQRLN